MYSIYLEVLTDHSEFSKTSKVKISLESFIVYCVYLLCRPKNIQINLVPVDKCKSSSFLLNLSEGVKFQFIETKCIPKEVTSCVCPILIHQNTVMTGLCSVCRFICNFRTTKLAKEHEDGILGFRSSCLQAPKEMSVWTSFCENDIVKSITLIASTNYLNTLPEDFLRFENHLHKPVLIHNKYKVARSLQLKESKKTSPHYEEKNICNDKPKINRVAKSRQWKSNNKKNSENRDLVELEHKFAEGPFLTLADLVLLPQYYILNKLIGKKLFEFYLPLTFRWYNNMIDLVELKSIIKVMDKLEIAQLKTTELIIPIVEDVSLYKCDPKRHNPKKRLFTKEKDIEIALNTISAGLQVITTENYYTREFSWNEIPNDANPFCGHLPRERSNRKSQQLENLASAVLSLAKDGDVIVDFCCGSGHLGIIIAHLLPKCTVILLENKEQSLLRAKDRIDNLDLKNVLFFQCNVDFFIGKFDIGIALHACGVATDLVLDKCLKSKAKFVLSPCCYGSLHVTDKLNYPRSRMFRKISTDNYLCICHAADQTHEDHPLSDRGNRCMSVVDSDRARLAEENGYKVILTKLKPASCTPKNNMLIGVPS